VVKVSQEGENSAKIFINIYFDSRLSNFYVDPRKGSCLDRKGNMSGVFNVCYPSDMVVGPSCQSKTELAIISIRAVKDQFGNEFGVDSDSFSLPAIVKGFMGDDICVFHVPKSNIIDIRMLSTKSDMGRPSEEGKLSPSITPSHIPVVVHNSAQHPKPPSPGAEFSGSRDLDFHTIANENPHAPLGIRFWGMHTELHDAANSGCHQRYFVITDGIIKVFQWSIPGPPFGKDLKS
jgi:hypothetical protein